MGIVTEVYLPIMSKVSGKNGKTRRKLGNNTYGHIEGNTVYVTLHNTSIVTANVFSATYTSGGWETATTKDRINQYLPSGWILYQKNHVWYLARIQNNQGTYDHVDVTEFYDGITFVDDSEGNAVIK